MDSSPQLQESPHAREQLQPQSHPQAQQTSTSPPTSTASSPRSFSQRRSASPLSLDLSSLPPLSQPSAPSNTLLITQLNDPTIFHPASLATIRQHINTLAPLHSFSPLKSFHRIVCSFYDAESAISVRQHLDGAALLGNVRARVYFGEPTPIGEQTKYLDRPDAGRLFFISPPPSPPVGWEAKEEDPPNKDVYASDLAEALGKLSGKLHMHRRGSDAEDASSPIDPEDKDGAVRLPLRISTNDDISGVSKPTTASGANSARNRSRSSTVIYDPEAHGDNPGLPAVTVEDTTMDPADVDDGAAVVGDLDNSSAPEGKRITAHTARPPVELVHGA